MLAVLAPGKRNRCQDLLQAHVFLLQITQYREDRRRGAQTLLHNHHHHSALVGSTAPQQAGDDVGDATELYLAVDGVEIT